MNINEVMSTDVKICGPDTSLEAVARMMWENDCGAIPIVDEQHRPIGIITDRDITMAAMHQHQPLWDMKASHLIKDISPWCAYQEESLEHCLSMMESHGVRRIMVINRDGTLAGLVSMGDIVAFTSGIKTEEYPDIIHVLGMLKKVSGHHACNVNAIAIS